MPLHGTYEPSTDARVREQVELYERTEGAEGATMRGMPVVVLTCVGARSGNVRKVPLMRVEHDGEYAVVASLGGAPAHPTWYHNLVAHPHVELRDGAHVGDYLARELEGDERDLWWSRSVDAFPDYADYAVATDRVIPVFVLEPFGPGAAPDGVDAAGTVGGDGNDVQVSEDDGDEIESFWQAARGRAGLGKIEVVGGVTVAAGVAPPAWAFGDDPRMADALLGLVLSGTKTATSSARWEYDDEVPLPAVGDLSIVLDGSGHPRALVRVTEVAVVPFDEVTEEFAAAEGEGDRTLESWRKDHEGFFRRALDTVGEPFTTDMPVVTERLELLYPRSAG
ncbi:nitroreductase/quinone reductase family protein [Sanguibacter suaedae]|uniref:Nitroreductase family deazaflavin-dependent oxidoreductase n=1 Tax=Sanguibacter suaedae TaxID=2795737 RepID=A0A934IAU8_9MICO|nr:nitroreductase/quinone reductase family protein [Sanguibacter suaedae]MBI9114501.1 nitroreductase family deazaflavin-dependent oxidoreductase [Sanguibacter suaedae]